MLEADRLEPTALIQEIKQLYDENAGLTSEIEKLRDLDRKLRLLSEHVPDVIWFLSIETMTVTYISPSVEKLLGYKQEEVFDIPFKHILTPHSYEFAKRYMLAEMERINAGQSKPAAAHTFELEYVRKDSRSVWVEITAMGYPDANGRVDEVIGVSRDITKRREAERALVKSEERYHALFETSMDPIYISSREGIFIDANPAAVLLLGFESKTEMLETPVPDIYLHPEDRLSFQADIESQGFVKDYPVQFVKKDGTPMDCLLSSSTWQSEDGTILGYQGIIRDITEQNRLKAQLLQAQKMEAIGTLAGGIAHNFNNILMTIQGNTSLMLMKTDPTHPHYQKLRKIEQYIEYGSDLSSQLLGFARCGTSEKKATNLNRLIENSARMFSSSKKEVTIDTDLPGNVWPVEVDRGQIEQVMMNLFVNAWQAMPNGGKIYIQTQNVDLSAYEVAPRQVNGGPFVKVSVTDTGQGMDAETRQKIFDPFFTTKKHGEGTGLGLSTVYGILKKHDGYITVYSERNNGTTFNIYLPATEKSANPQNAYIAVDFPLTGNETVLLVDDEEIIMETGQTMLEEIGYRVLTARSGAEAVDIYNRNRETIELVVLDLVMPDMNGGQTFETLKGINPEIKVLLSSGYGLNGQATDILDRGCSGFIQKPFNLSELSLKVREILDQGAGRKAG